jgi:hypothetical protein
MFDVGRALQGWDALHAAWGAFIVVFTCDARASTIARSP